MCPASASRAPSHRIAPAASPRGHITTLRGPSLKRMPEPSGTAGSSVTRIARLESCRLEHERHANDDDGGGCGDQRGTSGPACPELMPGGQRRILPSSARTPTICPAARRHGRSVREPRGRAALRRPRSRLRQSGDVDGHDRHDAHTMPRAAVQATIERTFGVSAAPANTIISPPPEYSRILGQQPRHVERRHAERQHRRDLPEDRGQHDRERYRPQLADEQRAP